MGIRLDQTPQADARARWLEAPRLRTLAEEGERHASWLELFFDLVFVVAITELSHQIDVSTEAQIRTAAAQVPDGLLDQQRDRQALRLLDTVNSLQH